jgi:Coenzyme PQQ synthesis protein D (PqqD)
VRYRVADERVAWNNLAGQVLILEMENSQYFRLNRAGGVLWEHVASAPGPVSSEQLIQVLVDAFGITEERAAADVTVFLDRMSSFGLLEA